MQESVSPAQVFRTGLRNELVSYGPARHPYLSNPMRRLIPTTALILSIVTPTGPSAGADPVAGLTLPAGFTVAEFAGPQLANDIYTLHVDDRGRVVVAGRGYVRQLIDTDGDGQADSARELVAGLSGGPMGVLWEGDTLYLVVDGGLRRYRGVDGSKPAADGELILKLKTGGEHDAHAVRRGADGWLYLLCGNMAGVTKATATGPNSPVKDPVAGCLLRISPDGTQVEVVADGFRNPYDFDFSPAGEPFTFDSDNERCVGLPWYEPTRFYHVVPGGNYGWRSPQRSQMWRKPPYFFDVVPPVATVGRGSPTGVACYRSTAFPEEYRGGFFLADWTFGKVWFVPLAPKGDTYAGTPEPFLAATGENGFAPTGLAVHPTTGELFVSIGGRGTRGAVYRVKHKDAPPSPALLPVKTRTPAKPRGKGNSRLDEVRALQLELGDLTAPFAVGTVWEGYTFRTIPSDGTAERHLVALRKEFPTDDPVLNRELSRTLAALGDSDPRTVVKVAGMLTADSHPVDDVHYLTVLGQLTGPRTEDDRKRIAAALLGLDRKFDQPGLTRDRHWPLRLTEAVTALCRNDTKRLAEAIVSDTAFGRPDHVWLARVPAIDQPKAARRFVEAATRDPDFPWTPGMVELLAALPYDEFRPWAVKLWDRGGLEDALMPLIARSSRAEDRHRFIAGLRSTNPATVEKAALAVAGIPFPAPVDEEYVAAVQALRRLTDDKTEVKARAAVVRLLQVRTGRKLETTKEWEEWVSANRPDLAKRLAAVPGYDADAWRKRLAGVKWDAGDPAAGKKVFARATCAACHDGGQAVGPPLQGVAKRFGRDDLLSAVLDPNRDVSPRYRATRLTTDDGKVHDGIVVYEAVDGVILQTGADATIRVAGDRIESRKPLATSAMPAGLLDRLTDAEVADLFAYLRTL